MTAFENFTMVRPKSAKGLCLSLVARHWHKNLFRGYTFKGVGAAGVMVEPDDRGRQVLVITNFPSPIAAVSIKGLDLPLQALLMAVWRRKPKTKVHVHSDQGSQFTGYEWQEFLEQHNLVPSMSRRGNCWDNAVVESFFNLLKRERIRRKKYKTRKEARRDVFDYIEFFYNPQRKHVRNGMLSPIAFEQQQKLKLQGV